MFDNGIAGMATTSPWATFAINPLAGVASNQFVIGSSTATNLVVNNSGLVGQCGVTCVSLSRKTNTSPCDNFTALLRDAAAP
jgi:hypothetical protein